MFILVYNECTEFSAKSPTSHFYFACAALTLAGLNDVAISGRTCGFKNTQSEQQRDFVVIVILFCASLFLNILDRA